MKASCMVKNLPKQGKSAVIRSDIQQLTLNGNSVPTDVHVFKGLPHGFRRYGDELSESERWDRVMEEGITWALSNPEAREFEVKTT
jgi:hypothetical protein